MPRRETTNRTIWARSDGISLSGYHEWRANSGESWEVHWPAGECQKSKALIDFASSRGTERGTRLIAHVPNPPAVRPVTYSVHWYESRIQKFFRPPLRERATSVLLVSTGRAHVRAACTDVLLCSPVCVYPPTYTRTHTRRTLPPRVYALACV
jgi:hypothetical protein